MNEVETLTKQTEDAYHWVNKLITPIPYEKWDIIPPVIESSISWQVGHLLMSFYYHSIMVIAGHQKEILEKVPLKEYSGLFTNANPRESIGRTNPLDLLNQLVLVEHTSLTIIQSLSADELERTLAPTKVPHPIAKNKFEALDWNIKHTMWHCGQIGMLKRIVHERYDFGLKKDI